MTLAHTARDGAVLLSLTRAATLQSRLDGVRRRSAGHDAGHDAGVQPPELQGWCATLSRGDWPSLHRRLTWDGLDPAVVARMLGDTDPTPADLGWSATLTAAYGPRLQAAPAAEAVEVPSAGGAAAVAFGDVFAPLMRVARERVRARVGPAHDLLTPQAHAALEGAALQRLSQTCARALFVSFSVDRVCRHAALGMGPTAGDAYADFVAGMRAGGMRAFFVEYPVAARLCATIVDLWVEAAAELIARLADDAERIRDVLAGGKPLGPVVDLSCSLSDPHEGGRGVMILHFAGGHRVVYKPRPVGLEECFGDLARWLNARAPALSLAPLRVVARPTHGWLEFAAHAPCAREGDVARFYERCGALLCIAYALNGSDFHFENLIAAGDQPVLIDLETLLSPDFAPTDEPPDQAMADGTARRFLFDSVLALHMLPQLKVDDSGGAVEVGAFRAGAQPTDDSVVSTWVAANTAAMRPVRVRAPAQRHPANLPMVNGRAVTAREHVEALVVGFRRTYAALLAGRDEVLAPGGPIACMRRQRVRFILRNTSLYAALLERCNHPNLLRDGVRRGVELDVLCRTFLTRADRPTIWPVLRAEQEALERLDIPLFTADADSTALVLPTGDVIEGCFRTSAFDMAVRRMRALSPEDEEAQVELIRASFAAVDVDDVRGPAAPPAERRARRAKVAGVPIPSDTAAAAGDGFTDRALAAGVAIAERVIARSRARRCAVGAWVAPMYHAASRRYVLGAAPANLLDGYVGFALFLAVLARVTGDGRFADQALASLRPLHAHLPDLRRSVRVRRWTDVGAGTGLGSTAYALARLGTLVNDTATMHAAADVAALIDVACVEERDSGDLMAGSAGAILGLLALADAPGGAALERAVALGDHLLRRREGAGATAAGYWPGPRGQPETGMAHGHAGIAYALHRLATATGEARFASASADAFAYERTVLGPELCGLSGDDDARAAWARGAGGIGLARLAVTRPATDAADAWPDVSPEVHAAVRRTRDRLLAGPDTLCCGVMGRTELLLSAGRHLRRPELVAEARGAADHVMARASVDGAYNTGWGAIAVGLAQGSAGIGYQLLRLAAPDVVPNVLLWA